MEGSSGIQIVETTTPEEKPATTTTDPSTGSRSSGNPTTTSSGSDLQYPFQFALNPERPFETLSPGNRDLSEKWEQWGLSPKVMQLRSYQFDNVFKRGMVEDFLLSLFRSAEFQYSFQIGDGRGGGHPYPPIKATSVNYRELNTNAISLDLFAPAEENEEIIRGEEGDIRRMMDVYLPDGITVSDQWRALFMLGDESEFADTFPSETQREFLYHCMWRAVSGGALNQWEDNVNVYKNFVRELYKDLVSVGRNAASGEVEVTSYVFQILDINHGDIPLFPRECGDVDTAHSNFNFFYVIVNPTRREAIVWYNAFWSPF